MDDYLNISNKNFKSRLIVGTGKYKNFKECSEAIKASGAQIVTVAVRRVNIFDKKKPLLMDYIDPKKITYLPNTAGCFTSSEALRTLRLAREIGGWKLVKLEVLGDKKTLFPDMIETIKSTEVLTKEGFKVMVYCSDDPLMAKRLENAGAVAIMPLAAPIGSGLGILNKVNSKGMGAWRTGHRPGANRQQWGFARVYSFLVKGKAFYTADNHLAVEAMKIPKAKKWFDSIDGLCDQDKYKDERWCS